MDDWSDDPRDAPGTGPAEAAVRRALPGVAPVAVLLTDRARDAEQLLAAALPRRRALRDRSTALHRLVSAYLADPPTAAAPPPAGGLRAADDDPALQAALAELAPADRAAAVLALVAGLDAGGRERVLPPGGGTPDPAGRLAAAVAARDEEERRARAEHRAVFLPPGAVPVPEPVRSDPLPDRLAALARRRALPDATVGAVAAEVRAVRRRRRTAVASAAAALLVLAVLATVLPQLARDGAPRSPATAASVYAGPTRGSLAGDTAFLRAVRTYSWSGSLGAPGPSARRVVYADDGPGGRWVLVTAGGTAARPVSVAWFVGARGASADDLSLLSARTDPDPTEALAVTSPSTGDLAVVGLPGDRFSVSDRPEVDDSGAVTRVYRSVRTAGGASRTAVPVVRGVGLSAVLVRAERGGRTRSVPPPDVVGDPYATTVDLPLTTLRPPPPPAFGDAAVEPQLRDLLGQLGQSAPAADATVLWAGDLPGPQNRPARLSVVAVRRPSGSFVLVSPYGYAADLSGRSGTSFCGLGAVPAGDPLADRVVAVRCDLSDGAADRELSRFLVVVGPRAATSVRLRDVAGAQIAELPAPDGVAVVRSPGPVAQVQAVLPGGQVVQGDLPAAVDLTG